MALLARLSPALKRREGRAGCKAPKEEEEEEEKGAAAGRRFGRPCASTGSAAKG